LERLTIQHGKEHYVWYTITVQGQQMIQMNTLE